MKLWEILVPTMIGTNPVRTKYHKEWDAKVRAISGGLTILLPAKGHWISPANELFVERMIPVRMFSTKEQMEKIADITAEHYKQLAIMYYALSEEVIIKHYKQ